MRAPTDRYSPFQATDGGGKATAVPNPVYGAGRVARFADFMKAYPPRTRSGDPFSLDLPEDLPPYVSMAMPDGGYYVGLDMESMLHSQTLL